MDGMGVGLDLIRCEDYITLGRYLYGKRMLNVTVTQWIEDMNIYIFWPELFREYPRWFLETYLSRIWTAEIGMWYGAFTSDLAINKE
jgi:hypothetical protein